MSYRVLITEPIVESVVQRLENHFRVDVGKRGDFNNEEQLVKAIPNYDALLPMLSNPVTARVIEAGSKLKIIANHAVGYNNIDLEAAKKNDVKVANTPDVLTQSSADLGMALLLAVARKIVEAQDYLKAGKFEGWEPLGFLGMELNGNTLGIVGMGRIGTALARRAKAFGMNICYHNRSHVESELEDELDATYMKSVRELAEKCDVLSLNCPLTDETHHLVNRDILAAMPDHAIIINTARGPVIDEEALAEALHSGIIGGAGLDVFENEPEVHPRILNAPNCVITPHIASATHQSRKSIGMLAADAIIGVLQGKPDSDIPNLIQL
ncbi:D-glycerate dehydrogenase [Balneolaceae bacterium YR4-1]|uniref:D-glycerate dehydrogenase n=1 Tax=Halalkalibaculum roseum TaxID=2709311 RepID=A0A6M1SRT5_9BACT|nr:D-glycerate dehydrogenase [Halalkalibaculum roseum]NGP78131.1 D-glycerate dehydrogenase [Halalkalibaculum roseum]